MRFEYRVVRTYHGGASTNYLEKYFAEGYEFVHASEYIPSDKFDGNRCYVYRIYLEEDYI